MQTQKTNLDFSGENIYVGIDTHKKNWKVAVMHDHTTLKKFTQEPEPKYLVRFLKSNYPNANYKCAYEAGFCGFWIQKELERSGLECIIANPADVPTTGKEREFKTDPRDARKIAASLKSGNLDPIYIPTDEGLGARSIVRLYRDVVKNRTRYKNKIKSLINFYGIRYPDEFATTNSHWSLRFCDWLKKIVLPSNDNTKVLQYYIQEYLRAHEQVKLATRLVRELSRDKKFIDRVNLLRSVPGIGLITSMILLSEIEDIKRFKNLDKLCGYFGLVPSTASSGEKERVGEMTNRGNRYIKSAIIESAWMAIRSDPTLLHSYLKLKKRMESNQAIIRVAKKLVARIMFVLVKEKPYEIMH